jgi:hypothetical protein
MNKYSFAEFLKSCDIFTFMIIAFLIGVGVGIAINESGMHAEKHGCEYVEKTECKQVWVRK